MSTFAEKIFINGEIVTLDAKGTIAEAVAVKNGIIVAVGSTEEVNKFKGEGTEVVDLEGRALSPGFFDSHSHFPMSGIQSLFRVELTSPPVGNIRCVADMLAKIRERVAVTPKGEWIIGVGYDDTLIEEKRHLTKDELDSISVDHPIILAHISVHLGVANTPALKIMNITKDTPEPEGSLIEKDPVTGELTGLLAELPFMNFYFKHLPPLTMEQGIAAIEKSVEQYASQGVTTVQVGLLSDIPSLEQLIAAKQQGKLPLRVNIWTTPNMVIGLADGTTKVEGLEESGFTFRTAKTFVDGSIQGYTGYLSEPYHTVPKGQSADYRCAAVMPREDLVAKVKHWHRQGLQIALHGNGDGAIDDILYAYEEAQKDFPRKDARHLVIHSQMAREDQLDKMQELEVSPSFFCLHTYYWGDRHRDIFIGQERAFRIDPTKSALDRGMKFSIHTDTPVTPINQLYSVWSATNRISTGGNVIGAEQRIPAEEALKAATLYAAWQAFEEDNRGSIEPGKLADVIVLSDNPLNVPDKIRDINVLATYVGGNQVYKR